jgi:hypothetical protein
VVLEVLTRLAVQVVLLILVDRKLQMVQEILLRLENH